MQQINSTSSENVSLIETEELHWPKLVSLDLER